MFLIYRKYTFKSKSSAALYVDSDSDDEPLKRSVAHSQRLCNIQSRDQQQLQEEPEKVREKTADFHLHRSYMCSRLACAFLTVNKTDVR